MGTAGVTFTVEGHLLPSWIIGRRNAEPYLGVSLYLAEMSYSFFLSGRCQPALYGGLEP